MWFPPLFADVRLAQHIFSAEQYPSIYSENPNNHQRNWPVTQSFALNGLVHCPKMAITMNKEIIILPIRNKNTIKNQLEIDIC